MAEQRGYVRPKVCIDLPVKPKMQVRILPLRLAQQEGRRTFSSGRVAENIPAERRLPLKLILHDGAAQER